MADAPEPPRKFYQLKPKEFDRVNAPAPPPAPAASETNPASDVPPAAASSPPRAERIDVRDLARTASTGTPLLRGNAPANRPNDVHALLRENLNHADAAGLNDVALPPKRRSRRLRDYLVVMLPVNAFFGWWAFGPTANAATFIYGLAGMVLFTTSFTWVMFFIVEDY